jgi:lipopolysaccharide transport system ATP-binding protein
MEDVAEKEGRTILFVSHNMTALQGLCKRAVLFDTGCVVADSEVSKVVQEYIQCSSDNVLERVWTDLDTAPGNDQVKLHSIKVCSGELDSLERITVYSPLKLTFEYWNLIPNNHLNLSLVIYNIEDICIFNSTSEPQTFCSGLIRFVCHVPSHFLNNTIYRVRLLIVKDTSIPLLDENNLVTFEIHDVPRQGNWYGKWIGVVRPNLKWTAEVLEPLPETIFTPST